MLFFIDVRLIYPLKCSLDLYLTYLRHIHYCINFCLELDQPKDAKSAYLKVGKS